MSIESTEKMGTSDGDNAMNVCKTLCRMYMFKTNAIQMGCFSEPLESAKLTCRRQVHDANLSLLH